MGTEIERKFLVKDMTWVKKGQRRHNIRQVYLSAEVARNSIRVRVEKIKGRPTKSTLTVKGPAVGITRPEFDIPISRKTAEGLLSLSVSSLVMKDRYFVRHGRHVWHVDVYCGENAGLVTAEIELKSEQTKFTIPSWVGPEVSNVVELTNDALSRRPWRFIRHRYG